MNGLLTTSGDSVIQLRCCCLEPFVHVYGDLHPERVIPILLPTASVNTVSLKVSVPFWADPDMLVGRGIVSDAIRLRSHS